MAYYWGKFVPSMKKRTPEGDWEFFRNAENPARQLKSRAKELHGRFFLPPVEGKKVYPIPTELRLYEDADASAMMLMWLCREQPAPDEAPDEVWHLTDRFGLVRTPWSAVLEPVEDAPEDAVETEPEVEEHSVIDIEMVEPEAIWRPPTLDELAERKVILIGDKRPLTAGAYSERQVEHFAPKGLRKPCPDCGVVPNAFTLECKC